jgi:hypothetical protein
VGLSFAPPYSDYLGAVGLSFLIKSTILPARGERQGVGFFAVDAPRKANADQRGIDRIEIGEEPFAWGTFVH